MWNIFKNKKKIETKYYYYILEMQVTGRKFCDVYIDKTGGFDFNFVFEKGYENGLFNFGILFYKEIKKQEYDTFKKIDDNMTEKKWKALQREKQINSILED